MTPTDKQLLPLGPWPKGINNRADETTVPEDQLRAAVNVDLTDAGQPRTRSGRHRVVSGACHSAWARPQFPYLLAVSGNALVAYDGDFTATIIRSGLKPSQSLSYAEVNGDVYWSNGFDNGKLNQGLLDQPFALAPPTGSPNVLPTTGAMPSGTYQVACTFQTTAGEESGSTLAALVTVAAGGIAVSQIPQPNDSRVMLVRIYLSPPNGDVLYWYRDLPVGLTSITIGNVASPGKMLETQWLSPLPPGQIVRYYNGRVLVASDNVIWIGEPFRGGQTRRSQNFVTFDKRITLMEPVGQGDEGGLFVTSGHRTYYLPGADPKNFQRKIAHPFGTVPGTGLSVPGWYFDAELKSEAAFWMDDKGVPVLGMVGGGVRALSGTYIGPLAESGSSLIRDINGIRSIIANLRGTAFNTARASDSLVATVERNGVSIS